MSDVARTTTRGGERRLTVRFAADTGGTTAIEYALIAGGIAVAIAASVYTLGTTALTNQYQLITEGFSSGG